MYAAGTDPAAGDSERTAFRKAEKVYKLYKSTPSPTAPARSRRKQSRHHRQTDLSDVVDFAAVLDACHLGEELPTGIFRFECPDFALPVFCFRDRPGFYFIPGALSVEEQCHWVRESLTVFPQPPNRTNHTAIYGPIHGIFDAVRREKILVEMERSVENNVHAPRYHFVDKGEGGSCQSVPALAILRKLRWATLGLQFDWSKRNYDISLAHNKIPDALCLLAKKMAKPAMLLGEEFRPESAIVNYFGPSDMLGGHLDDMEADWSKPIVSISLGCKAIFLLGGKSREDSPVAMFLRSGDIVLMAGQARECFHGVPRILIDDENADISSLASQLSGKCNLSFMEYIQNSRININIRQVF